MKRRRAQRSPRDDEQGLQERGTIDGSESESSDEEPASSSSLSHHSPPTSGTINPHLLSPILQCTQCINVLDPLLRRPLKSPTTLPCGHTFCRSHFGSSSPIPTQITSPTETPKSTISCPLAHCGQTSNSASPGALSRIHPDTHVTAYAIPTPPSHPFPSEITPETLKPDIKVLKIQRLIEDSDGQDDPSITTEHGAEDLPRKRRRVGSSELASTSVHRTQRSPSSRFQKALREILTCEVCFLLYFDPITPTCGHTFCARCLRQTMDQRATCPLCRQPLGALLVSVLQSLDFLSGATPVNKILLGISLLAFPKDYVTRRQVALQDDLLTNQSRLDTPIYLSTQSSFPGMKMCLNFFESKNRLMLRRLLATPTPQFGMMLPPRGVIAQPSGIYHGYGTIMQVRSVQLLPDGQCLVEVEGVARFRAIESCVRDGYILSRIEKLEDLPQIEDPKPRASASKIDSDQVTRSDSIESGPVITTQPTTSNVVTSELIVASLGRTEDPSTDELVETCRSFVNQMKSGSAPFVVQQLNNTYGNEPTDDIVAFAWWIAALLPMDDYEKAKLLPVRSPELRLRLVTHWITEFNERWWYNRGCVIS